MKLKGSCSANEAISFVAVDEFEPLLSFFSCGKISKGKEMVSLNQNVALSASILALLSFISLALVICMLLVYWRYRSNERKKTNWKNSPSELRTGWLLNDRKLLVPGKFSAKTVQPDVSQSSESSEDFANDSSETQKTVSEEWTPCGKIFFILRYLVDREELMVRLVQLEGFSTAEDIYNADSAYVDVQLKHIGCENGKQADNPPKLDIALQQVYYFIISQDQLFSYKLVFRVNTFDESFRRTVTGEVEVDLFEELKKHIFTGTEVILSKDIRPISQASSNYKNSKEDVNCLFSTIVDQIEDYEFDRSPIASPLSWDDECEASSTKSSGPIPYEDLSSSGVQWHRLSGDSWEEQLTLQWPHLSDSVVSVPSSFLFNRTSVEIDFGEESNLDGNREGSGGSLMRRSISESYIPHYGRLSPPPKNFYHLVPSPLVNKQQKFGHEYPFFTRRITEGIRTCPKRQEQSFTFDDTEHECLSRKRSLSVPSLSGKQLKRENDFVYRESFNQVSDVRKRSTQPR